MSDVCPSSFATSSRTTRSSVRLRLTFNRNCYPPICSCLGEISCRRRTQWRRRASAAASHPTSELDESTGCHVGGREPSAQSATATSCVATDSTRGCSEPRWSGVASVAGTRVAARTAGAGAETPPTRHNVPESTACRNSSNTAAYNF